MFQSGYLGLPERNCEYCGLPLPDGLYTLARHTCPFAAIDVRLAMPERKCEWCGLTLQSDSFTLAAHQCLYVGRAVMPSVRERKCEHCGLPLPDGLVGTHVCPYVSIQAIDVTCTSVRNKESIWAKDYSASLMPVTERECEHCGIMVSDSSILTHACSSAFTRAGSLLPYGSSWSETELSARVGSSFLTLSMPERECDRCGAKMSESSFMAHACSYVFTQTASLLPNPGSWGETDILARAGSILLGFSVPNRKCDRCGVKMSESSLMTHACSPLFMEAGSLLLATSRIERTIWAQDAFTSLTLSVPEEKCERCGLNLPKGSLMLGSHFCSFINAASWSSPSGDTLLREWSSKAGPSSLTRTAELQRTEIDTSIEAGILAARISVGLSVGNHPTWTVSDTIAVTKRVLLAQDRDPGASFISQRGIYQSETGEIVEEESVQIVIYNVGQVANDVFRSGIIKLAKEFVRALKQERVYIEFEHHSVTKEFVTVP